MLSRFSLIPPVTMVALALAALTARAADTNSVQATASVAVTATPVASPSTTAPKLSPGVDDVLKLSQARVSDDTVVAYIQSSDRGYGALSASEIAYLHGAGVSDVVVRAMLDKRKSLADANAQWAQAQQPAAATAPATTTESTVTSPAQSGQVTAPAATTYVQPAPSSSVSVYYVPNTPMFPGHPYYYSYPYYYYPSYGYGGYYGYGYGYRGYYGPSIGLSFGFGGGYRGGHWGHHR